MAASDKKELFVFAIDGNGLVISLEAQGKLITLIFLILN
jgi:hypothetical protein